MTSVNSTDNSNTNGHPGQETPVSVKATKNRIVRLPLPSALFQIEKKKTKINNNEEFDPGSG